MDEPFDSIVLSGGGNKGIIELGTLQYYTELGLFEIKKMKETAATSIGSVIILLLMCGYTPSDIFLEICVGDDFFDNDVDVANEMGLMSITPFLDKIEKLVVNKLGYVPTLKQLYVDTNVIMNISETNVSLKKECKLSYLSHSDLNVISAVGYSCSLPFIFERAKHNNHYVADGALVNNFPWNYISNECTKTLGIFVGSSNATKGDKIKENELLKKNETETQTIISSIKEFFSYAYTLSMIPATKLTQLRLDMIPHTLTLVKCDWACNFMKTSLTYDEKMNMFLFGWHCAERKHKTKCIYIQNW